MTTAERTDGCADADAARTFFAPAERAGELALRDAVAACSDSELMQSVLRAFGGVLLVLNEQRQIVAVNRGALRVLGCGDPATLIGKRPGEALGCARADEAPSGCGTGILCRACGAAISIVSSLERDAPQEGECHIETGDRPVRAYDLTVRATPLLVDGLRLCVVTLQDVSARKRRDALERTFFHDLLNTVASVTGYAEELALGGSGDPRETGELLVALGRRLTDEIEAQRDLARAEEGKVKLRLKEVQIAEVLDALARTFAFHPVVVGRAPGLGDARLTTDPLLLGRVLTNMVKNALDARAGEDVHVSARLVEDDAGGQEAAGTSVVFEVWNRGAIDEHLQPRVFERYFSTKAERGRGIGTFSMKLLGEGYLGGDVGFASREPTGTTFWIRLPRTVRS